MNLFRNKYKRRAALGTILVHLLAIFIFYSFGLKYMDPKIEEGIAIEFGYVEEGMGEEITQTEEVRTEEVEQIQDVKVSAPEEQTEMSEEVVTQDMEDAPVINEEKEEEKTQKEAPVKQEEKKPQASDELQQALTCLLYTSPSPRDISGSRMPSSA